MRAVLTLEYDTEDIDDMQEIARVNKSRDAYLAIFRIQGYIHEHASELSEDISLIIENLGINMDDLP